MPRAGEPVNKWICARLQNPVKYRGKGRAFLSGRTYLAIDLKSFYASVECVERGLDPMTTHLVVADQSRTDKTICLAVSPALKAYGVPGRARLFEARQAVEKANRRRRAKAPGARFPAKAGTRRPSPPTRRWRWTSWWLRPGWPTTSR